MRRKITRHPMVVSGALREAVSHGKNNQARLHVLLDELDRSLGQLHLINSLVDSLKTHGSMVPEIVEDQPTPKEMQQ